MGANGERWQGDELRNLDVKINTSEGVARPPKRKKEPGLKKITSITRSEAPSWRFELNEHPGICASLHSFHFEEE